MIPNFLSGFFGQSPFTPAPSPMRRTELDIEDEFLKVEDRLLTQCTLGISWPNDDDIRALSPDELCTLKDDQGRSLAHILLTHPASDERDDALRKLFEYCPGLLKVIDPNSDTPLDILYRMDVDIVKFLEAAYKSPMTMFVCICFSKHAKDIITKHFKIPNFVDRHYIDTLPRDENPMILCRELGKLDVLVEMYRLFPSSENYGKATPNLCTLLTWKDLIGLEVYFKNYAVGVSVLSGILGRLHDIGYDITSIKIMVNQLADSRSTSLAHSRETLEFLITFECLPKLIYRLPLPADFELFFAAAECSKAVAFTPHVNQIEILIKMFKLLLEKNLFDMKRTLKEKHFILYSIPLIYQTNKQLAETMVIKCAQQGLKNYLFTYVCYAQLKLKGVSSIYQNRPETLNLDTSETKPNRSEAPRATRPAPSGLGEEEDRFGKVAACPNSKSSADSGINHDEFFKWIVPLFQEEKIPIQLISSSDSPVLHEILTDFPKNIRFYKHIRELIPEEQIFNILYLDNEQTLSPHECLLFNDYHKEEDKKIKIAFMKNFTRWSKNINPSARWYRSFVFEVLLYGDEEFDAIFPLDKIDHEALVKPEDYAYKHYKSPFFVNHNCHAIARQRKFLEFMVQLPKKIQTFLLSNQEGRTSLKTPVFPFQKRFLLKNILESGDEAMLQNFVSLGGKFVADDFTGLISDQWVSNVLELIIDQSFSGRANLNSAEYTKSFMKYILNKLGTQYRDFTVRIQDNKIYLKNHECEMSFADFTTQKAIDYAINSKKFSHFKDTEKLRENELKAYKDIIFHNYIPENPPIFFIINKPDDLKFIIVNINFDEVADNILGYYYYYYSFPYDGENVLDRIVKQMKWLLRKEKIIKVLKETFPEFKVSYDGNSLEVSNNDDKLRFKGIPSLEEVKEKLFCTLAPKKGFEEYDENLLFDQFSLNIERAASNKTFFCFSFEDLETLKLLSFKNEEKLSLIFCEGVNTLDTSIATIEAAHNYSLNYQTAKNIKFLETIDITHDSKADVDFDRLNQLLNSYEGSDYLNNFLEYEDITYEVLSSALKTLVSSCCQGVIKDWDSEESQKLIIQLSHVILKKLENRDEDELRRFVCELALEANFCGWAISRKIISEYKMAFNLLDQGGCGERTSDSIFRDLYAESIRETIATMIKFVLHPFSQDQSIHVESYLRSILQRVISLPSDLMSGDMRDKYRAGEDDYPRDKVVKFFEAFFIPILIQKLMTKQKEDNDAYPLLLQNFAELIPLPEGIFTEIEEQKNTKLADCETRLKIANDTLQALLISTKQTQNLSAYHEIERKIGALSKEWLSLYNKEPNSDQLKDINVSIAELDKERLALKGLMGETFSTVEKLQTEIQKLKQEKDQILESFRAKKQWKAEEIAEKQGLLTSDDIPYLTLSGAIKLLELKGYIKS